MDEVLRGDTNVRRVGRTRRSLTRVRGPSLVGLVVMAFLAGCSSDSDKSDAEDFDPLAFAEPLVEHHPYVRWWWPGGAVDAAEIDTEIETLARMGFGGAEVQAFTYGMLADDLERTDVKTWGTAAFFDAITAADEAARAQNIALDLNFGSAWPAGAPSVDEAPARQLVLGSVDIVGPTTFTGPIPPPAPKMPQTLFIGELGPFDENVTRIAVVAATVTAEGALDDFRNIEDAVDGNGWEVPAGTWRIFAVYENESRQLVANAAYSSDAPVVDHLDSNGTQEVFREVGDPLFDAAPGAASVFVDSFELSAELPWTGDLLDRFRQSKGYDPTALLPLLFRAGGEPEQAKVFGSLAPRFASVGEEARVREDYEDVRHELFMEEHIRPLREWAHARNLTLRLQAHGGYADYIDAYAEADIPESESLAAQGSYDFLKLASSGGHVAGARYISSESFVGSISDPRGLSIDDFYLLAGRAYSAGINRLVYHGFTYRFAQADGELWYPWGSGIVTFSSRLDEEHPVWGSLSELNAVFARTTYAMTRGRHAADIAWFQPELSYRDGISALPPVPRAGESDTSRAILEAGYVYDRVSRRGLTSAQTETDASTGRAVYRVGQATYRAFLIQDLEAASPEMLETVERIADAGIPVVVLGDLPSRARGFADHESRDEAVRTAVARLQAVVIRVDSPADIGDALRGAAVLPPVEPIDGEPLAFSPERRRTPNGDILLLFNESNDDVMQRLRVNLTAKQLRVFDPEQAEPIDQATPDGETRLELEVPARRWRILVLDRG